MPCSVNVGISAQGFATYRMGKYMYIGGTFGAAFTSDVNVSGLLGAAFVYGKNVKVALSGGYAFSTERIPSGVYNIGQTKGSESLQFVNYPNNTLSYDYCVRNNWFLSITIAFAKPVSQTGSQNQNASNTGNTAQPSSNTANQPAPAGAKPGGK